MSNIVQTLIFRLSAQRPKFSLYMPHLLLCPTVRRPLLAAPLPPSAYPATYHLMPPEPPPYPLHTPSADRCLPHPCPHLLPPKKAKPPAKTRAAKISFKDIFLKDYFFFKASPRASPSEDPAEAVLEYSSRAFFSSSISNALTESPSLPFFLSTLTILASSSSPTL